MAMKGEMGRGGSIISSSLRGRLMPAIAGSNKGDEKGVLYFRAAEFKAGV